MYISIIYVYIYIYREREREGAAVVGDAHRVVRAAGDHLRASRTIQSTRLFSVNKNVGDANRVVHAAGDHLRSTPNQSTGSFSLNSNLGVNKTVCDAH